jgi:RNA polymerase sigma-70 factor (ECF subfamily)
MLEQQILERARVEEWTDEEVVQRVLNGDVLLFELLMRRHNQRIYRAVRSILRDDAETEDVMQETYVRAYEHLAQFEGRARFSTWLTRIAVNESIKRSALQGRLDPLDEGRPEREEEAMPVFQQNAPTPEANASSNEMTAMLEKAILALPGHYRAVVMLRDIEQMSTEETAEALSLSETNVKVRLHRAHELLRDELMAMAGTASPQAFGFGASRCDRVVQAVLRRVTGNAVDDIEG